LRANTVPQIEHSENSADEMRGAVSDGLVVELANQAAAGDRTFWGSRLLRAQSASKLAVLFQDSPAITSNTAAIRSKSCPASQQVCPGHSSGAVTEPCCSRLARRQLPHIDCAGIRRHDEKHESRPPKLPHEHPRAVTAVHFRRTCAGRKRVLQNQWRL